MRTDDEEETAAAGLALILLRIIGHASFLDLSALLAPPWSAMFACDGAKGKRR